MTVETPEEWLARCESAYRTAWDTWAVYVLENEGNDIDRFRALFHEMDQRCDDLHEARKAIARLGHPMTPRSWVWPYLAIAVAVAGVCMGVLLWVGLAR